ncbi:interferon alpha-inducible protein 27-like protein 1 [Mytilus galloprovincialis]|uniref:interferon alpha-inducible protein 27-like protein 1 n=1 Tax=Mytilus galloprovincialis TaxID=29158 RepID=UPI003F7B4325
MERKYITVCVLFVLFGTPVKGGQKEDVWCRIKKYGGAVLVGGGTVAVVKPVLGVIGFGPAGIVAGTFAASAMAFAATANGGGVVAGGVIATLQSAGAAGLGLASKAIIGVTSSGIYSYLVGGCSENDIECKKKGK